MTDLTDAELALLMQDEPTAADLAAIEEQMSELDAIYPVGLDADAERAAFGEPDDDWPAVFERRTDFLYDEESAQAEQEPTDLVDLLDPEQYA